MRRSIRDNIICGRHSGFPWCCVMFYTFIWEPLFQLDKEQKYTKYYTELSMWSAKKRNVLAKIKARVVDSDEVVDIEYPLFNRVVCPFCLVFTRQSSYIECNCTADFLGEPNKSRDSGD